MAGMGYPNLSFNSAFSCSNSSIRFCSPSISFYKLLISWLTSLAKSLNAVSATIRLDKTSLMLIFLFLF
jgi:hypothetical protein